MYDNLPPVKRRSHCIGGRYQRQLFFPLRLNDRLTTNAVNQDFLLVLSGSRVQNIVIVGGVVQVPHLGTVQSTGFMFACLSIFRHPNISLRQINSLIFGFSWRILGFATLVIITVLDLDFKKLNCTLLWRSFGFAC